MLFALVTWLSFTFTQSFTLQHLKALCVTVVSRFFPPLCKWGEQEWQGQLRAVVGPESWMWLLSDLAGRQKHHQVGVVQLATVTSTMQHATGRGETPFPCLLWNLIQPFPLWYSTVQCTPAFSSLSIRGMCGICLKTASQAWFVKHDVFFDISCVVPCGRKPFLTVLSVRPTNSMCAYSGPHFTSSTPLSWAIFFNIYSVFLVLIFTSPQKKRCLHQCTVLTFLSWILQKYWLFRIKWKKSRIAWINDVGIFTEILLGKGWHI